MWYALSAQASCIERFRDLPHILPHGHSQLLFFDVTAGDIQNCIVVKVIFLAQHHTGVCHAGDTGRAGHVVEDIAAVMLLAVVMDQENAHFVIIGKPKTKHLLKN